MRDVLLIRPDKAGDALKTIPVLRALRKYVPDVRWNILASDYNFSLFVFEPGFRVFKNMHSLSDVDIAVNLLCDPFPEVEYILDNVAAKEKYSVSRQLKLSDGTAAGKNETENIAGLL